MITELTTYVTDLTSTTAHLSIHTVATTAHHATQVLADGEISVRSVAPPGTDKFLRILGWLRWVLTAVGIAGLMVAGGLFAWERWDHGQVRAPKLIAGGVIGAIVIAIAPQIVYASMS
ncbi:MAG: hypothetical protein INR66_00080 [Gordonia polyisoprenivorans]|nr:hypothetical protein [Gordonia polyisoprenivorans]